MDKCREINIAAKHLARIKDKVPHYKCFKDSEYVTMGILDLTLEILSQMEEEIQEINNDK